MNRKISRRTKTIAFLLAALALAPLAIAQVQRMESFTITIVPTLSVSTQNFPIGSVQGGSSGSQTFKSALAVQSTTAGTRTFSMTLSANATLLSKFNLAYIYLVSDMCDLSLTSRTCSFTLSLQAGSSAYFDAVVSYTTVDGYSATTAPSVLVSVS